MSSGPSQIITFDTETDNINQVKITNQLLVQNHFQKQLSLQIQSTDMKIYIQNRMTEIVNAFKSFPTDQSGQDIYRM